MNSVLKISNEEVNSLLNWPAVENVCKQALLALSGTSLHNESDDGEVLKSVQTQRTFTPVPSGEGLLLCMPSYLQGLDLGCGKKERALACKLLTVFDGNSRRQPPLPSIDGSVILYDGETGVMKAMIDADMLTLWRTAAITCAATKILRGSRLNQNGQILAIVGAGHQGRMHAKAFHSQFHFDKIRVWNRTQSKAEALVHELNQTGGRAVLCTTPMECVQGADVIVTTTFSPQPLVQDDWVKADALINAIGVIRQGSEISPLIYKRAQVYVESKLSAQNELRHLGIDGDLGEVSREVIPKPATDKITVFQSLGSGVEDAAVGLLLFNLKTCKRTEA